MRCRFTALLPIFCPDIALDPEGKLKEGDGTGPIGTYNLADEPGRQEGRGGDLRAVRVAWVYPAEKEGASGESHMPRRLCRLLRAGRDHTEQVAAFQTSIFVAISAQLAGELFPHTKLFQTTLEKNGLPKIFCPQ